MADIEIRKAALQSSHQPKLYRRTERDMCGGIVNRLAISISCTQGNSSAEALVSGHLNRIINLHTLYRKSEG